MMKGEEEKKKKKDEMKFSWKRYNVYLWKYEDVI